MSPGRRQPAAETLRGRQGDPGIRGFYRNFEELNLFKRPVRFWAVDGYMLEAIKMKEWSEHKMLQCYYSAQMKIEVQLT